MMNNFQLTFIMVVCLFLLYDGFVLGQQALPPKSFRKPPEADALGSGPQANASEPNQNASQPLADSPCHKLQNDKGGKFQVRCVGKLRSRLILITGDYLVYDLPMSSLSSTIDKLYIDSNAPVAMSQKWPQFTSSPFYTVAKEHFYNCFTAMDASSQYLLITTKMSDCQCPGATYNIDKNQTYSGLAYRGSDDQVLISSSELNQFYAINKVTGKGLSIMRYHFSQTAVDGSSIVPDDVRGIFYPMCSMAGSKIAVLRSVAADWPPDCAPLNWPILKGFIADGKFYLFGSDFIFTFPREVYDQDNQSVNYESRPFSSFIQCSSPVGARMADIKKTSDVQYGLLIALILFIVICILCCLLFLARAANQERNKAKRRGSGGGSSGCGGASGAAAASKASKYKGDRSARTEGFSAHKVLSGNPKNRSDRSANYDRHGTLSKQVSMRSTLAKQSLKRMASGRKASGVLSNKTDLASRRSRGGSLGGFGNLPPNSRKASGVLSNKTDLASRRSQGGSLGGFGNLPRNSLKASTSASRQFGHTIREQLDSSAPPQPLAKISMQKFRSVENHQTRRSALPK